MGLSPAEIKRLMDNLESIAESLYIISEAMQKMQPQTYADNDFEIN